MARQVLSISAARRSLPSLVKQVAEGGGPVYIGPRGEPIAVLVSPADLSGAPAAESIRESGVGLNGWESLRLEIVGSWSDILADRAERLRQRQARLDAFPVNGLASTKTRRQRREKASPP